MDACEEYARRWAKKEDVEVDTLLEWVKSVADVPKRRIRQIKRSVHIRPKTVPVKDLEINVMDDAVDTNNNNPDKTRMKKKNDVYVMSYTPATEKKTSIKKR